MARKAMIIASVADGDGSVWDVHEARTTHHGFDLYFGWPQGKRGPGWGGPRLIPMRELLEYFESVRLRRDGAIYDFPASRTTIKRVRAILGKHIREAGWWREESAAELLASELPRSYVEDRLDISVGSVGRLRHMLAELPRTTKTFIKALPLSRVPPRVLGGVRSVRSVVASAETPIFSITTATPARELRSRPIRTRLARLRMRTPFYSTLRRSRAKYPFARARRCNITTKWARNSRIARH